MDITVGLGPCGVAEAQLPCSGSGRQSGRGHTVARETEADARDMIALPRDLFEQLLALARVIEPDIEVDPHVLAWPPRADGGEPGGSVALARKFYQLRRRRSAYFDPTLFAEPAWDILLDLYVAESERRPVAVLTACLGAAAPQTTAIRWMRVLEMNGLIRRETDSNDARRIYVRLTEPTVRMMRSLLLEAQMIVEEG
jgi:DNA-binding MarR family transcriptional regulator